MNFIRCSNSFNDDFGCCSKGNSKFNLFIPHRVHTWISNAKLCPLKAKAIIPSAFMTEKADEVKDGSERGSYDIAGGLCWLTERTHTMVQ